MLKVRRVAWSHTRVVALPGFALLAAIGCEAEKRPQLGALPEGDPVEMEPGYADLPALPTPRAPVVGPGCQRTEPRSSASSPAIEILSSGGMTGGGGGNVQVFEDGTVLFDGAGCPGGIRRGRLSPARVRALIDTLEAARFSSWPCDEGVECDDSVIKSLTVFRGGAAHTVVDSGCDSKPTLAAQAVDLVMKTVGKNACSPACVDVPTAPSCR
jgi:hypothetical protein